MKRVRENIRERVKISVLKADQFFDKLYIPGIGFKNSVNQPKEIETLFLNGTWAAVFGKILIQGLNGLSEEQKLDSICLFNKYRQSDGLIYPAELIKRRTNKSHHYLKLHINNYASGAMLEINPEYDFQSSYLDQFLDPDILHSWLDRISFIRPWEESNNIVNVASYLDLHKKSGNSKAEDSMEVLYKWHHKFANPKSGGFDKLSSSYNHTIQSMAGAVHNFHLYYALGKPIEYPDKILSSSLGLLSEGPLSACFSIDFVELAVKSANEKTRQEAYAVLRIHLEDLLSYQNTDGGWYEGGEGPSVVKFEDQGEQIPSSSTYSTWFRLCSIGMIMISLFNDQPKNWKFRKTLGMGYFSPPFPNLESQFDDKAYKLYRKKYQKDRFLNQVIRRIAALKSLI